ncbi:MAG: PadR family transcriptional regulator [Spirochaetes bacterium]|nr:PadR family transcriptional regulator [Spirochaetota bacterium]
MSLPHALLGLLKYMPMTGYELKKFFDDSINYFWSAQISQIYRELKKLEENGYIKSARESGDKGPDKIRYSITDSGFSFLKDWLSNVPENIDEDNRNAFLLRIMLLSNLGAEEMHMQIQMRLEKYRKSLAELETVREKLSFYLEQTGNVDLLPFWKITLNRGFHDIKSHIEWAEESLAVLEIEIKKLKSKKK